MSAWRAEARAQVRLALPVVVVQVGMMAMNVVDTMMVGHVDEGAATQIAAVAIGGLYTWVMLGTCMGVLMALDPLVAQAAGAGDHAAIGRNMQRGFVLGALLSLPIAGMALLAEPILTLLQQPPDVVPIAGRYALWSIPAVPAFLAFVVLRQTLQALHRMRPIVIAILAGNVLNVFLDWGFIHGAFGLPAMGAVGVSIATSIGRWLMVGVLVVVAWPMVAPYLRPFRRQAFEWKGLARMFGLGAPIGAQMLMEMSTFSAVGLAMGSLGEAEMAGHQVALNLAALAFMVPLGISAAAAVRVGHAVGRGDLPALRRAAGVALVAGAGFMTLSATTFALFPEMLARMYSPDAAVIAMAALLLPLAAAFQVFDGIQVVAAAVLRGAGDTRVPPLLYVLGFWLIGIPLCFILAFWADMGPLGLWTGLAVSLAVVAVVLLLRVRWRVRQLPARVDLDDERWSAKPRPDGTVPGEKTMQAAAIDRELNVVEGQAGTERPG
ncbi:MAG: MATE family efflux transporter [Planctomycetota bacterium]|jgi:MATE family multidrug resistance protein